MANPHILKLNALVILPVNIILLLIMFFGLFRLRFHKSSALGMGRLLWRQVGIDASPWPWCSLSANMSLPTHKIFVWLLAAIIADIVPVVCDQFHVPILSTYRDFLSQVFICLDLNCRFHFLSIFVDKEY
jgi:hypothetical protein